MLASRSPRRIELLRGAGIEVVARPVPCDETRDPGEPPLTYVRRIARAKLEAGRSALPTDGDDEWLAADTIVWSDGAGGPHLFGKPRDRDEARETLLHLVSTPHYVTTGWALDGRAGLEVHAETTQVWMRPVTAAELDRYLSDDTAWRDKAGGYGIQAEAAGWVTAVHGSYTNVVGLPLAQVLLRLQARRSPS